MAEGSRIRENPALIPVYCNRLIGVSWDGLVITVTLGTSSKLPARMGDQNMPEQVVDPKCQQAMPLEIAAELHLKLGQLLKAMQGAKQAETVKAS
jgi:hypothetical protein